MPESSPAQLTLRGRAAVPGVAFGPIVIFQRGKNIVRKRKITEDQIPSEINRLEEAILKTQQEIRRIHQKMKEATSQEDAAIFDAHLLFVDDAMIIENVKRRLREELLNIDYIYHDVARQYAEQLAAMDDPYLKDRAADVTDVSGRVLAHLKGGSTGSQISLEAPSIVVANDLLLTDLAELDRSLALGIATEHGSSTSHVAIMARALNLPAVVGIRDLTQLVSNADYALIDGHEGLLILHPTQQTLFEYGQLEHRRRLFEESLKTLRDLPAQSTDGHTIILSGNIELPQEIPLLKEQGAEGIGLYRTEFLFLNHDRLPTEEEQFQVYKSVAAAVKPHTVILRTLDIGGDKSIPIPRATVDANPFLGWRGIRLALDCEDVFVTQLRAMARAAIEGNISIMFPMIADIQELRRAKKIWHTVLSDLQSQGLIDDRHIPCGMMMEIPSAALMAEVFAPEVDFISIGTNDLVQYTLAVDRLNERVANLYQPAHPAVLRLIKHIIEAAHAAKIWVGICGEAAADIRLTPVFLGLGVDELSMGSVSIPRVKKAIRSLSRETLRPLCDEWLKLSTAQQVLQQLEEIAQTYYPDLLV
ncbi:MAG: phosphoenolpyruvate--protein phosphotransferase [Methylacidiphilales bacterium]|nr:phosphoenolpyruvate--protein phosphotransferase [Candidatus Methylacidiphilales bacterium]MDW8349230.1 phosphoenolpyruvate--protein phosphotransferase [Verrucomicrobiae bacterium]